MTNVYDDSTRAQSYAELGFPGTYYLAFRDLPALFRSHVTGNRALDFGCGAGRSTRFLREHRFQALGVDISHPMLERARTLDPQGDYRRVEKDLGGLEAGAFDLILSAFTFDNIPADEHQAAFLVLRRLLSENGRIVSVVSAPEIYVHEWASFSTKNYPENRQARSGDRVLIEMLDVTDRRPVEDVVCSDEDYDALYAAARLRILEKLRPLATGKEPVEWKSETTVAPWVVYVLGKDD